MHKKIIVGHLFFINLNIKNKATQWDRVPPSSLDLLFFREKVNEGWMYDYN
jgi:hypothetical protein